MRSSYKPLGAFIHKVENRNKDAKITNLLGLSMTKEFRKSTSNIIGTDLSVYKIVDQWQFACDFMSVIRVLKLPVVLQFENERIIVSPAYTVFEIIDTNVLLPEYLMMWFRRSEFDRYAYFRCDSAVRGGFNWEQLCEVELPIPSIEKQHEIVSEYNTIANRITLNETLNQKLEETAQAIYKHWFVDFEFPNEEGKPYKSSGGKMVFNEELNMDIPKEWKPTILGNLLVEKGYIRGPFGSALKKDDMVTSGIPVYEQQHAIDNHRNFRYFIDNEKHKSLKRFTVIPNDMVISCSGTLGRVIMIKPNDPVGVINQALLILRPDEKKIRPVTFKYYLTSNEGNNSLIENSSGSAQVNIAKREVIQSIPFILPPDNLLNLMELNLSVLNDRTILLENEINCLIELKNVILSKMSKVETEKEIA